MPCPFAQFNTGYGKIDIGRLFNGLNNNVRVKWVNTAIGIPYLSGIGFLAGNPINTCTCKNGNPKPILYRDRPYTAT